MATHDLVGSLDFTSDFWLILIMTPVLIFVQSWFPVGLIYKSSAWIMYSLGVCIITTILLAHSTTVNPEIVNEAHNAKYKAEYNYIENQVKRAKTLYNIDYDEKTKKVLRQWYTERASDQLQSLQRVFAKDKKVTLDAIIL